MVTTFGFYIIAMAFTLAFAYIGMDFSPSFTAMFVMVFLASIALGEVCDVLKKRRFPRFFAFSRHLFPILGTLLALPASYIYAAGDDWIDACLYFALLVSVILHLSVYLLLYRKQTRKMGIAAGVENLLLLAAGLFTLACAIPSTALWPYGFGLMLIAAARRIADVDENPLHSRIPMVLGMLLCGVFLIAPMLF